MNESSLTATTKMCDVCIKSIQEKHFERHKESKSHLFFVDEKVIYKVCKLDYDSFNHNDRIKTKYCFIKLKNAIFVEKV